jgi:hypothetical protein
VEDDDESESEDEDFEDEVQLALGPREIEGGVVDAEEADPDEPQDRQEGEEGGGGPARREANSADIVRRGCCFFLLLEMAVKICLSPSIAVPNLFSHHRLILRFLNSFLINWETKDAALSMSRVRGRQGLGVLSGPVPRPPRPSAGRCGADRARQEYQAVGGVRAVRYALQ